MRNLVNIITAVTVVFGVACIVAVAVASWVENK